MNWFFCCFLWKIYVIDTWTKTWTLYFRCKFNFYGNFVFLTFTMSAIFQKNLYRNQRFSGTCSSENTFRYYTAFIRASKHIYYTARDDDDDGTGSIRPTKKFFISKSHIPFSLKFDFFFMCRYCTLINANVFCFYS